MLEKLAVLPLSPSRFMANYLFANTIFDLLQLLVPTVLIVLIGLSNFNAVIWISITYIAVVLAANSIGVLIALIAGSSGEVHLYSTLTVLLVGAISIPFSSSIGGTVMVIGNILPFRLFYDSLMYSWGLLSPKILFIAPISSVCIATNSSSVIS